MEFNQVVRERRSIFKFQDKLVPVDKIKQVVTVGTYAPNHHLTQPWRFILLGPVHQRQLAEFYGVEKAFKAMVPDEQVTARIKQQAIDKMMSVPCILLVTCRLDKQPALREDNLAAVHCAIQNMLLAATNEGLGAQWSTHPVIKDVDAMAAMGIDLTAEKCVAMLYIGYAAVVPPMAVRKPVEEVLTFLN